MQYSKLLSTFGLILAFGVTDIQAQDIVYSREGHKFEAEVSKITTSKVYFRKHGVSTGPTYEALTSYVYRIEYENGTVDTFDENGVITINDTESPVIPVEELEEVKKIDKTQFSYSQEYGRNIFSAKALFNNREASPGRGWEALFPLFDGSFINYGGSYEHIAPNGLCGFEIPFVVGYSTKRSKELQEEEFVQSLTSLGPSEAESSYQIADYQQISLRFKLFPTGQEQISYFIGPYISGSRGKYQFYNLDSTPDLFTYNYELQEVTYTSMSVGMHNGMSITPGKFVTFNLGGGLGLQIVNTGNNNFERVPSYYLDLGLGIRL